MDHCHGDCSIVRIVPLRATTSRRDWSDPGEVLTDFCSGSGDEPFSAILLLEDTNTVGSSTSVVIYLQHNKNEGKL